MPVLVINWNSKCRIWNIIKSTLMELSQEFKLVKFTAQTVLINRFYRSKIKTYLIPSLEIYIYILSNLKMTGFETRIKMISWLKLRGLSCRVKRVHVLLMVLDYVFKRTILITRYTISWLKPRVGFRGSNHLVNCY
jgi:hypothetical protein